MIFKKDELRILWPFYLHELVFASLFLIPVFFVVYFIHIGLSIFQIGILLAVAPLLSLLFEIPTGAVADLYGRKFSVMLSLFLEAVVFLLVYLSNNFYYLLFIMSLWGLVETLASGSDEAWVIDLLNRKKKKELIKSYFIKEHFLVNFGFIISGIIGALFVAKFGISVIWVVTSISLFAALLVLGFGEEIFVKRNLRIKDSLKEVSKQTKKTISYGYKHPVLFYFLIAAFLMVFASNFNMFLSWIPFLQGLNFPDYAFGYMWSVMAFVGMIAPLFSKRLNAKLGDKNFIIFGFGMSAIITAFVLLPKTWIMALVILLGAIFFVDIRGPTSRTFFHKYVPSKLRATMGSAERMLISIACIAAAPIVGYLIGAIGARYTIFLSSILMIPVIFMYLRIKEK